MKLRAHPLALAVVTIATAQPAHSADSAPSTNKTAQQEMESVNYLIGTWTCSHVIGASSGRYIANYSKVLADRWLKETYDFPPGKTAPAVSAESLMGFDERQQMWVRFFVNSVGYHFEMRLTDTPTGWSYKYASVFPGAKPETPDPDALFTKVSDTDYKIDGPTYRSQDDGTLVTQHDTCHKV